MKREKRRNWRRCRPISSPEILRLQPGENTLSATATDACGYKVRRDITIHDDAAQEKIRLSALPPNGILGLSTGIFEAELEADAYLPGPITEYSWDVDGDGWDEETGADLSSLTAQYRQPGIYFPRVTVTDAHGASFWETTVVNVLAPEDMDARLKGTWAKMKEGLEAGDVQRAIRAFSSASRDRYREAFTSLHDKLPKIAADMGTIQLIYLKDGRAKYSIRIQEEGGEATYYIYFARDEDGLWRIHRF